MKKKFHLGSALTGLGLGILVTVCVSATSSSSPGQVGRYQVAVSAGGSAEVFAVIVDTATGKTWRRSLMGDGGDPKQVFYGAKNQD